MTRQRLGLEHEFVVSDGDRVVDFRNVIHELNLGQPNLDPADFHAYHLPSGAALIADGAEAEIALPPIAIRPGFTDELLMRAEFERARLRARLPRLGFEGGSTHLSVTVPDDLADAISRLYAATFSPALMLLVDMRHSPGLLIRPRPGRVELGGEFVTGSQLAAAAVFAVASVRACERALTDPDGAPPLPPEVEVRIEPAVVRYGWYVDRSAFGGDLYTDGRNARLRTQAGGETSAQAVLARCWIAIRPEAESFASTHELRLVDDVIAGRRPLPTEGQLDDAATFATRAGPPAPTAYGAALRPRRRPGFEMAPVMLTWDLAVFLLDAASARRAFAAVPGDRLKQFVRDIDGGALDDPIQTFLCSRVRPRRVLRSWREIDGVGLYDGIGPRLSLLRPEYRLDGSRHERRLDVLPRLARVRIRSEARTRDPWRFVVTAIAHARAALASRVPRGVRVATDG